MIKKFTLLFAFFLSMHAFSNAQLIQASIEPDSNNASAVDIWLKSNLTTPQDTGLSTLQFCLAIPDTFSGTLPISLSVDSSRWPVTWTIGPSFNEGGFICYPIITAASPLMVNFTANTDYFALRILPTGGTALPKDFYLICLPDGGNTSSALFYAFGEWSSEGSNLFYNKSNNTVNNALSYDLVGGTPGQFTSWVKINTTVPLALENIYLNGQWGNQSDIILDFKVNGNEDELLNYKLLSSIDGNKFNEVATIKNNQTSHYTFIDKDVANRIKLNNAFYKVTTTNKNGKEISSNIINLSAHPQDANFIYPVPVKDLLTINLSSKNSIITLLTMNGQILKTEKVASNLFKIDMTNFASGNYFIRIESSNGEISLHKFTKLEN